MDVEIAELGQRIRTFLRDLFGSRLSAHLEEELLRTRTDFETRLLERERVISDLREQLSLLQSKVDRYELVLLPLSSPLGGLFAPKKDKPPTFQAVLDTPASKSWAEIQADWDREQAAEALKEKEASHGVQNSGREA